MGCRYDDKINALLAYAINRRDNELTDGTVFNVTYWNGYIDALKRVLEVSND